VPGKYVQFSDKVVVISYQLDYRVFYGFPVRLYVKLDVFLSG
jgi:hypothetical protein